MRKFFKKKTEILSSRVVVRPHLSWQFRFLLIMLILLLLLLLSWGMFEVGRIAADGKNGTSDIELDESYNADVCLQKDRETLCVQFAELIRQFQIVQTTKKDLIKQTRMLGRENNQLREELDFFEHVMGSNQKIESGISIHHFNLKKDVNPGVYRYTLSLVQGGQRPKDFKGNLKFYVNLRHNDQIKTVSLAKKGKQQNFSISFKFYHRIEETFKVPPDAIVESMKVQIFEEGKAQVKLTQIIKPAL